MSTKRSLHSTTGQLPYECIALITTNADLVDAIRSLRATISCTAACNMNESETYIANEIRLRVWSGLFTAAEVQEVVTDILEEDADEAMLRALVEAEMQRKADEETTWPAETDCDKLNRAFAALREKGVIAIHNAGWDKREAFDHCLDEYREHLNPEAMFGICYYTWQDIESAVDELGMYLGYSSTRPESEEADAVRTGALVCAELDKAGLSADWSGDAKSRIKLAIHWQKRSAA